MSSFSQTSSCSPGKASPSKTMPPNSAGVGVTCQNEVVVGDNEAGLAHEQEHRMTFNCCYFGVNLKNGEVSEDTRNAFRGP